MTSIFGLPLDTLDDLTNRNLADDVGAEEKTIFVGGRYNQYHDNIFLIFQRNVTTDTQHAVILSTIYRLVSILPTLIVILCQVGFALIQSGASKAESAGIPFFVNMITFVLTAVSYFVFGHTLSQTNGNTAVGFNYWFGGGLDPQEGQDWLLGFALALTTTNIAMVGGLERSPLLVYVILTPVMSGIIHGLAVHWAWHYDGWLLEYSPFAYVKYQDFGGSGLVHVVGGASALVLSVILGPRYNRIREQKSKILYNDLEGHSVPLEMLGGYLLTVCYACISCSRVFQSCINCDAAEVMASALINVLVASGASCLITASSVKAFTQLFGDSKIHWLSSRCVVNGLHVGMVAVAAGCNVFHYWSAIVVGVTSAVGYVLWCLTLYYVKVDDPLGVAAVHLGGGIWGVICVSLFEKETGLAFGRNPMLSLVGVVWNLIGALTLAAFSGFVTWVALGLPRLAKMIPLPHLKEINGLDTVCIQQESYATGNKVTPFTTDFIEDRERYGDASPGSTALTNLTSPASPISPTYYSLTKPQQEVDDLPYLTEMSYQRHPDLLFTPSSSHHRSSMAEADRRVWFSNSHVIDRVTPESPLIDYHRNSYIDIEL